MNIKSELLQKPMKWFPFIKLYMFIMAAIGAMFLSLLIIGFGQGLYLKLFVLLVSTIIIIIWTFDNQEDWKKREPKFIQGTISVVLLMLFTEIPLFYNSFNSSTTQIKTIVTDETRDGDRTNPNDKDATPIYKKIKYKKVSFYNLETNEKIDYKKIEMNNLENLKIYTNIIGIKSYIDYFPFMTYEENFKYIRDNNDSK